MAEIPKEIVERALAAKVTDWRADDESERSISVSDAMQRYGFHHPIDPAELVTAIVTAAVTADPDAERYRAWRDAILAEDEGAREAMRRALPADVGPGKRAPTPAEWDAAMDALIQRNNA